MIEKLLPDSDATAWREKVNEVIDALNSLESLTTISAPDLVEALGKLAKPEPADPLTPTQREWVTKHAEAEGPAKYNVLAEALMLWNVSFYDDVGWDYNSPVYCRNCQYRSQTLLDRMLLNPRALCVGCAHKAGHG